jgi:hypothetical protein
MPELWIKICGIRSAADIEAAAAAGADALGFVFYEPSPRHLAIGAARMLQEAVPAHVERVAVFLHPSQAEVDAVIDALHPDWVQTDLQDLDGLRLPAGSACVAGAPEYRLRAIIRRCAGDARRWHERRRRARRLDCGPCARIAL